MGGLDHGQRAKLFPVRRDSRPSVDFDGAAEDRAGPVRGKIVEAGARTDYVAAATDQRNATESSRRGPTTPAGASSRAAPAGEDGFEARTEDGTEAGTSNGTENGADAGV